MTLEAFVAMVPGLVLVFARVAGLFITSPILGGAQVPVVVRVGASLAIGALVLPFVQVDPNTIPTAPVAYASAMARETLIGVVVGFGVTLLFTAIQIAGEVVDVQMGFMMANVTDPTTNISVPMMGQFLYLLAVLVFLSVNGHHWMIRAVVDSYRLVPLGGASPRPGFFEHFSGLTSEMFVRAVQFGAPAVIALVLTEVAMGVVSRAVPQMNILMLGFSVRIAVGFAAVWFALATIMDVVLVLSDRTNLYGDLIRLVRGLGPPP
jgi:flagellar biosynthetic protein FliR